MRCGILKILVVTVAGQSGRFSESVGYPCLKCIYYKHNIKESLLYKLLHQPVEFDRYIIVGGFMFDELERMIHCHFKDMLPKIHLIRNDEYGRYGSGYSLYLGICDAMKEKFDELVFAEGDLFFDTDSFRELYEADSDVVTCNREPIFADKAVAFYYDLEDRIHYIYDTCHEVFTIQESFRGIFNSGQIWKFKDYVLLKKTVLNLKDDEKWGTNLVIIQKYFSAFSKGQYRIIQFDKWINCNTIKDFREREEWTC